ncbi:MAG: site-2 protease family protein [Gemmatimonadota bacterium]|nr:MAG: site-2 protease family protein [Gemmatimonadota bacterium]
MDEQHRHWESWASSFDPESVTITGTGPRKPRYRLNLILFLATVVTTLFAGTLMAGYNPLTDPRLLYRGIPFSFSLIFILGIHEMGHYFASKRCGVKTTLPYFIPVPPPFFLGTLGAFIKIKSRIFDRKGLMDIGAAGPLSGFVVSVVIILIGLKLSRVVDVGEIGAGSLQLGESLLFSFLSKIAVGPVAANHDILLHPIAFAGWLGLFVTVLNLIPIGQFDGGPIAYALLGNNHRYLSGIFFLGLVPMGFFLWPGWFVWIMFGAIVGLKHPPPTDDRTPLDSKRKIVGLITLIIFILCFIPTPIQLTFQ